MIHAQSCSQSVIVIQPVQHWIRHESATQRLWSSEHRIWIRNAIQSLMDAAVVVPANQFSEYPVQLSFIPNQHTVKTLLATPENSIERSRRTLAEWATDSLQAARLLYCLPGSEDLLESGTRQGEEYFEVALPVLRLQLARAGARLAWTLNQIFH